MKLKLAAVAVALLVVATGAAAALPGNAPDHAQGDEHANADGHAQKADGHAQGEQATGNETADETATDAADSNASEAAERRGPPADVPGHAMSENASDGEMRGPPADMPAPVPDFVGDIHDLIRQHVNGSLSGADLGQQIAALVPGGQGDASAASDATADTPAGNATGSPADTPTGNATGSE